MRYYVVGPNNVLVTEGMLGNKAHNSYVSFNYLVDSQKTEGYYQVCFTPTDSLFFNAAEASKEGNSSMFGRIFQQQDFSKLNFELSVTLERVFHDTFKTRDEVEEARSSDSSRKKMAASNSVT